jgi:hypothetical protein
MAPNDLSEHAETRRHRSAHGNHNAPNERSDPLCHENSGCEVPASAPVEELESLSAGAASCGEANPSFSATTSCDARVGIVVERATNHFDRRNLRHPERPSRVASIVDTLTSRGLLQRCSLLDTTGQLLQDEDYLRVHLPGYMQR